MFAVLYTYVVIATGPNLKYDPSPADGGGDATTASLCFSKIAGKRLRAAVFGIRMNVCFSVALLECMHAELASWFNHLRVDIFKLFDGREWSQLLSNITCDVFRNQGWVWAWKYTELKALKLNFSRLKENEIRMSCWDQSFFRHSYQILNTARE